MRLEISALVREAGATTVYITHDQAEAFALADRVGVLERGRLVQQGTPEEIYTQPATPFVARFTGLSGELPVQALGRAADSSIDVELAGAAQARPFRARGPGLPIGAAAALLMIRPTGVRLCPATPASTTSPAPSPTSHSAAAATSTPSTFPGTPA
jgi:ABC-type Fe3+/spermidine/putrescine transport system ATPase subunit